MIRSRSVGKAGKALAHNRIRCVTRADDPYAVSARCRRFVRCRVLLDHKAGGLWDGCARKLLACRASRSSIRPLASLGPAADAGIASTHHLTAVARACEARTGLGTLPVQCEHAWSAAELSWMASGDSILGAIHVSRPNSVVGEDITTCARIDCIRRSDRQSDKATANRIAGEELS